MSEVVHRVVVRRSTHWLLCCTGLPYQITVRVCMYDEPESGPIVFVYADEPITCMACLVKEARSA